MTDMLLFVESDDVTGSTLPVWELHAWDYARAYKAAACALYGQLNSAGNDGDVVALPYVYLWRHHVELCLKALLQSFEEFNSPDPKHPFGHHLMELWREWHRDPGSMDDEAREVEAVIAELASVDVDSFTFRYPKSKKWVNALAAVPKRFSLRTFQEQMMKVAAYMEKWFFRADHALERHRIWRSPAPMSLDALETEFGQVTDPLKASLLSTLSLKAEYLQFPVTPDELVRFCDEQLAREPSELVRAALLRLRGVALKNITA
jgi:hypothetical protein